MGLGELKRALSLVLAKFARGQTGCALERASGIQVKDESCAVATVNAKPPPPRIINLCWLITNMNIIH